MPMEAVAKNFLAIYDTGQFKLDNYMHVILESLDKFGMPLLSFIQAHHNLIL